MNLFFFGPVQGTGCKNWVKLVVQKVMLFGLFQRQKSFGSCWVCFWKTSEFHFEVLPLKTAH